MRRGTRRTVRAVAPSVSIVPASTLRAVAPDQPQLAEIKATPRLAYELFGLTLVDSKVDFKAAQQTLGSEPKNIYLTDTFARARAVLEKLIETRRVGVLSIEGADICPLCGSKNTQRLGKQGRSADEATTGFARCKDCSSIFFPRGTGHG